MMDKQIFDLLTEMNKELKSLKLDMKEFKSEMHNRFDKVEAKLEGVGGQLN